MAGSTPRRLRLFGLTLGGIFLIIALVQLYGGRRVAFAAALIALSAVLLLFGLLAPSRLAPVYERWMAFARALAWLNTRIILSAVFFLVVTPLGLVLRFLGKDPLERRFEPGSYWRLPERHSQGDRHFERQF